MKVSGVLTLSGAAHEFIRTSGNAAKITAKRKREPVSLPPSFFFFLSKKFGSDRPYFLSPFLFSFMQPLLKQFRFVQRTCSTRTNAQ